MVTSHKFTGLFMHQELFKMKESAFTYRQLDLLGKSTATSPLRVIALIDFNAFYAQCETVRLGLSPATPLAVQQWNAIIALNYPARKSGLARGKSVEEAKRLCPGLVLQHVATWREGKTAWAYRSDVSENMSRDKSALDPYRLRSRECFELIRSLLPPEPIHRVEKASIDEVYLDLSAQVHAILLGQFSELAERPSDLERPLPLPTLSEDLDWEVDGVIGSEEANLAVDWDDVALCIGAKIVRQIRAEVWGRLKYTCSAGIAHNKMLAKLGAGFRKPNQQTVVPNRAVRRFLAEFDFTRIRGLGGKLGLRVRDAFGSDRVADLVRVPLRELKASLGDESGVWVYNTFRRREASVVNPRIEIQSMLSAKTFVPSVAGFEQAIKWLRIFAADLMGRLNELPVDHTRRPTVIALHHHINGRYGPTRSKQTCIPPAGEIDEKALFSWSKDLLRKVCEEVQPGPVRACP
ncbi:hypothetical protein F5883DRAFT_563954 [Diaporthe sp. PMI_573]|nr:hypothetical protein F5883DRAFT_563954 [Diaporthaceae sp. PMI_573]